MAQEYTMTEAGLSPATSPEFRAKFRRAKRLFDVSQRRPNFTQGAAIVVSETVEPGFPRRPIPCIYPQKMPRNYGPSTSFDADRDYAHLCRIAWTDATCDTLVIVYRGADGGTGTARLQMPMPDQPDDIAKFNEKKSDYLRKLTGGSGLIDTRGVVAVWRDMDATVATVAKAAKAAKAAPVPVPVPVPVPQPTRVPCLESIVAELRDEVIRLTRELHDARECADTDAADAIRAREAAAELRAEINGLRYLRLKITAPPAIISHPIARF